MDRHIRIIAAAALFLAATSFFGPARAYAQAGGPAAGQEAAEADPDGAAAESSLPPGTVVEFSLPSGAYLSDTLILDMKNDSGLPIRFTTDGSDPGAESDLFAGPVMLTGRTCRRTLEENAGNMFVSGHYINKNESGFPQAAVIRAAAELPDGSMGPVTSGTYFTGVSLKARYGCVVISVITDPENLFSYENGILVRGKLYDENSGQNGVALGKGDEQSVIANYTQKGKDWERPAFLQVFDGDDGLSAEAPCGIRVRGRASRHFSQRSFNLYFRKEYGQKSLEYSLIPGNTGSGGKEIGKYRSFVLRNGGNDAEYLKFKDAALQEMLKDCAFATQAARPAVLFLNGEYYGVFTLTEKYSDDYIESHYGVDGGNVVMIEEGELEEGADGDMALYEELRSFIDEDMTDPEVWRRFLETVDPDSMTDYYAAQIYIGNADWNEERNCRLWRSREDDGTPFGDGRWRWILCDTEYSSGLYSEERTAPWHDSLQDALADCPLFASAMKNEEFREMFLGKLSGMIVRLGAENAAAVFDRYYGEWQRYYGDHFLRFGGDPRNAAEYLESVKEFFRQRGGAVAAAAGTLTGGEAPAAAWGRSAAEETAAPAAPEREPSLPERLVRFLRELLFR